MISVSPDAALAPLIGPARCHGMPPLWTSLLVCACAIVSPVQAASAEPATAHPDPRFLRFDSVQSRATFEVKVLLMFSVKGQFGSVSGGVHVEGDVARVEAAIDANAVSMNRESNEEWVKSAEFFDVDRHPQIFFDSQPFPLARLRDGGSLPGTLNMRGVTRNVAFDLQPVDCERPAIDCAVQAIGAVRRSEFGMDTRRGALADKVELSLSVRVIAPLAIPDPQ